MSDTNTSWLERRGFFFLAILLTAFIGIYIGRLISESNGSARESDEYRKRSELYEQTVKIVSSLPALEQEFGHYFWPNGNIRDTANIRRHPEVIEMLASTRAEMMRVLSADRIHFGMRTAKEVNGLLGSLDASHKAWWEWKDKDFQPLLDVMLIEGKLEVNSENRD